MKKPSRNNGEMKTYRNMLRSIIIIIVFSCFGWSNNSGSEIMAEQREIQRRHLLSILQATNLK